MQAISSIAAGTMALGFGVASAWLLPPGQGIVVLCSCAILAYSAQLRQLSGLVVLLGLLAWSWTQMAAWQQQRLWLPQSWWQDNLLLSGTLTHTPQGRQALRVALSQACHPDQGCRAVRFGVQLRPQDKHPWGQAGDRVVFQGRLVPIHQHLNPGGLDHERQAFALKQGYRVRGARWVKTVPGGLSVASLRAGLSHRWSQAMAGLPHRQVLQALLLGGGSDATMRQTLSATGTVHLLAISGLHVVLLAQVLSVLLACLPWRPRTRWVCIAMLLVAYTMLAGCSPPTVRAALMWLMVSGASCLQSRLGPYTALACAAACLWFWDPSCVLLRSFWLSFVAMLFVISGNTSGTPESFGATWWGHVRMGWGLLPLSVFLFQQASWVAPLANWIAIPCFAWLVVPCVFVGALLGLVWLPAGGFFFACADSALQAIMHVLTLLATLPGGHAPWTLTPWAAALGSVALFGVMHAGVSWRLRGWGAVLVGGVLLWGQHPAVPQNLRVVLFDVGQGLSVLVQTPHHALLYDTGTPRAFDNEVARSLRYLGLNALDVVVISHGDQDHAGGLPAVRDQVRHVYGSASVPEALPCHQKQVWLWDGITIESLPTPPLKGGVSRNNQSCVLRVSDAHQSWLLAGDVERRAEHALVAAHGQALQSDVLVSPHHGSKTSSSALFLQTVAPASIWLPVGLSNPYGHPHAVVMARYLHQGLPLWRTDRDGAVVYLDGQLSVMRSAYRLWRARGPRTAEKT